MDEGITRLFDKQHPSKLTEAKIIGRKIYYFDEVDSTHDMALKLALEDKRYEGTVIVSNMQTKGKGRLGRKWYSPKGGIYFSIILRPDILIDRAGLITLMTSVAVTKSLRELGILTQVKWPNDIVAKGRKLCGILTEIDAVGQNVKFLIIGVGINNTMKRHDLPTNATSIYEELHKTFSNEEILKLVLTYLDKEYMLFNSGKIDIILKEFKQLSSLLNKPVRIILGDREVKGEVQDFDSEGALILRHQSGVTERFISVDNVRMA